MNVNVCIQQVVPVIRNISVEDDRDIGILSRHRKWSLVMGEEVNQCWLR